MTRRDRPPPSVRLRRGVPTVLALACVALGLVDILSAVTPERAGRLKSLTGVVPVTVAHAASAVTVIAGLLLVMLGLGLRRRKRRAWRAAVALLLLSTVLHLVKGLDVEEASVTFVIGVALLLLSDQFFALGDPRTRRRAPVAFVAMTAASVVVGLALLAARDGSVVGSPSFGDRLREVLWGLVGVSGPVHFRTEGANDVVFGTLLALGAATALVTAYLALRPAEPVARLTDEDERRLRALLDSQGHRDSLGYFALRRDKSVVFSATGKSAISYRVVSGVMLASGDPIGDPEAWPGAIAAFLDIARRHAWVPAVVGCSELGGEVWVREADVRALELGDEAIVDVADFSLEGRAMRNVRQMVGRVERAGYTTQVRRLRDLSADDVADIQRQAAAWRGTEVERGFSMALGRFGDANDDECVVVTASRDGRVAAVLHFVPWGCDGLSLELMRRDQSADPGLNELMIVAALRAAPDLGVRRLSLNFAVFRSALERGGRLGAGPVTRAWRELLLLASRWFQIESLYRFNAKFRPVWEPRFVCYPGAGDLPRVAIAALEAEAFLVWPRWSPSRLRPRRWPRVAIAYVSALVGAYAWWALQSPQERLAVLAGSSTDLAHLERAPWLVLPASSIWPGDLIGYWAVVVLLCLGALEWLRGALTTAALGVAAHVAGTVVSEGITAVRIAAGDLSSSARHLLDVGPSYAVAACAAAVLATPRAPRWMRIACGLTLVPLVVTAFDLSDESQVAAIGHAVAMLLGLIAGRRAPRPVASIDSARPLTQR